MPLPQLPFRDPARVEQVVRDLSALPAPRRSFTFMHVCGTHENAVARYGLRTVLPPWLRLIAGPGCPVCVCPEEEIAAAASFTLNRPVTLATFGDMVRVPAWPSLDDARSRGGDVRIVLGVADAVALARATPARDVVFFGVGFETTACTTAAALLADPPPNFSVLSVHRRIPPALAALWTLEDIPVDGFLLPGHVLTVTGTAEYESAVAASGRSAVVAGFEPLDLLLSLLALARSAVRGEPEFRNAYRRAVRSDGNAMARRALALAFRPVDAAWRGLGMIPRSGYAVGPELRQHDARARFEELSSEAVGASGAVRAERSRGCRCGDVMVGRIDPSACPLFADTCTPESPQGACMVSSEGTCRSRFVFREV